MRPSLLRPAAVLALLAICLQAVVCALGGRICLQASSLAQEAGCEAHCCDDGPSAPATRSLAAALDWLPAGAGDPVCCIHASSVPVPGTEQTEQRGTPSVVAASADTSARPDLPAYEATTPAAGRAAHPPPMLEVVRATVLLI
jgi:hypothetical protein